MTFWRAWRGCRGLRHPIMCEESKATLHGSISVQFGKPLQSASFSSQGGGDGLHEIR